MTWELSLSKAVTILTAHPAAKDWSDGCVTIFDLLVIDHARQRSLMKSILNTRLDNRERLELFEVLQAELMAHAAAEEHTFYAELLAVAHEKIQQSVAGNDRVAELTFQLRDLDVGSSQWLATFMDLKAEVEIHLDLEELQLFPYARRLMKRSRANHLGKRFEQMKLRELCLAGGGALKQGTAASLRYPEPSGSMNMRQQPGRRFASQTSGRGSRRRAISPGRPRASGG